MKAKLKDLCMLAFVVFTLWGCTQNDPLRPPDLTLQDVSQISQTSLKPLEGIYTLVDGDENLGTEFVCKVSTNAVSFFSNKSGIFFILQTGLKSDSTIALAGFWRVSEKPAQGPLAMGIVPVQSKSLLKKKSVQGLRLIGKFESDKNFTLQYSRDFSATAKAKDFVIFGHHGVLTNSNPPFLENTLEAVRQASAYGANGLEVDVRLTADNVPVLFHDPDLNIRVVEKSGILANVDQVPWQTLVRFVRLHDGQRIPSLEEALKLAVDSTDLRYMWLDIKGNPDVFKYVEPIVRGAVNNATAKGRDIKIITDIPTDEVMTEYLKQPTYATLPVMAELELDKTISINAQYWGPRWTLGLVLDEVDQAHQKGIKVYTWTLNSESIIVDYLQEGKFDGFITDYPAYGMYHFYTKF